MGVNNCIDCDKKKAAEDCNCIPVENADGTLQDVVLGCTDPTSCNYNALANCDDGSCIDKVEGCMNPTSLNYSTCYNADCSGNCPGSAAYIAAGPYGDTSCCCETAGCTDPAASNYNAAACIDDGSCAYPGCMDPAACNYNPGATVDDGSCAFPTGNTTTAQDCGSYTWSVNNQTYTTSGIYTDVDTSGICDHTETLDLTISQASTSSVNQTACLTYTWSGPTGNGNTYTTSGTYTSVTTNAGGCDHTETLNLTIEPAGCTDSTASNYNPNACSDDGSCTYPVSGCTDATACNYNASATIDDGSCTYGGCNDPLACNYDPAAGCDDGSCIPPSSMDLGSASNGIGDPNPLLSDGSGAQSFTCNSYGIASYPYQAGVQAYGAHCTKNLGFNETFDLNGTGNHTGQVYNESYYFELGTGSSTNPYLNIGQTYCITWAEIVLKLTTAGQCSDCLMGGWGVRIDTGTGNPSMADLNSATDVYDPVALGTLTTASACYDNSDSVNGCSTNVAGNPNSYNTAGAPEGSCSMWNEKCTTFTATAQSHRIHVYTITDFNLCTSCRWSPGSSPHGTYCGISNVIINTACSGQNCSC